MLEHNGKFYARVSEILSPFTNFVGIPEEVLNNKALLGTHVHEAIKQDIEGDLPFLKADELGYFKSFHQWMLTLRPKFIESEMRYYCDEKMVTGCIDALIKLDGEEECILVDFKTSAQESPTWIMQAHLYHYLIEKSGKKIAPRFLFLKLDKGGDSPRVFQYKFDSNVRAKCLQAIDSYWEKAKLLH